jgi:hypothetical protein
VFFRYGLTVNNGFAMYLIAGLSAAGCSAVGLYGLLKAGMLLYKYRAEENSSLKQVRQYNEQGRLGQSHRNPLWALGQMLFRD